MKLKASKCRMYPTVAQKELIHQHFGCARWLYNYALNKKMTVFMTFHAQNKIRVERSKSTLGRYESQ